MDKIKETQKIKHLTVLSELSKSIVTKIMAMEDLPNLKLDLDIVLYICNVIENTIKQTETKGIDKKQIVIGILQKVHIMTAPELLILNKMIEFLHSNHLITKISKIEKNGTKFFNWAVSKIV